MKNKLSLAVAVIDQGYIKRHCLERDFWSKSWKILEFEGVTAIARLEQISPRCDTFTLRITAVIPENKKKNTYRQEETAYTMGIPLNRDDYTDVMFNKQLLSAFETCIRWCAWRTLRDDATYKSYEAIYNEGVKEQERLAAAYCQAHNITDDKLVEAVTGIFVNRVEDVAGEYASNNEEKLYAKYVAALAWWLGLKNEAAAIEKTIDPKWRKRQSAMIQVKLQKLSAVGPEEYFNYDKNL